MVPTWLIVVGQEYVQSLDDARRIQAGVCLSGESEVLFIVDMTKISQVPKIRNHVLSLGAISARAKKHSPQRVISSVSTTLLTGASQSGGPVTLRVACLGKALPRTSGSHYG